MPPSGREVATQTNGERSTNWLVRRFRRSASLARTMSVGPPMISRSSSSARIARTSPRYRLRGRVPSPAVLGLLALTVVLVAVCFVLGQGILAACGAAQWRWWAPALGYAVLLIVGGQVVRIPHHATAMVVVVVAATLGSMALAMVRRALREAGPEALVVGIGLTLVAAIPFFAIGRPGVLGASVSNDMSQHLTAAFFLRTGHGLR